MKLLYAVAESDADAEFYALCLAKLHGATPQLIIIRGRKRRGVAEVQRVIRDALKMARQAAGAGEVGFLAAVDNDRAPHPENEATLIRKLLPRKEQPRPSRQAWMIEAVEAVLGADRARWPLPVALAVPVEMIESWIVKILRPEPLQPPRHFSRAASPGARDYYKGEPPPQWKDLARAEQEALGLPDRESFYLHVVQQLDPDALAERSLSFAEFKAWLDAWPAAAA